MANRRNYVLVIGVAVVALILGVALGSTLFVIRTTQTTTRVITQIYTVTSTAFLWSSSLTTTSSSSESSRTVTECDNNICEICPPNCLTNANYGATLSFPINIVYNGSWRLVYWAVNFCEPGYTSPKSIPHNEQPSCSRTTVLGNLTGSGNYGVDVELWVSPPNLKMVCANATNLNPRNNPTLTLSLLGGDASTNASNLMVEACGGMAP